MRTPPRPISSDALPLSSTRMNSSRPTSLSAPRMKSVFFTFFGGGASRGPRTRTRQGNDALIHVEIDLHDVVADCVSQLRPLALSRQVTLTASVTPIATAGNAERLMKMKFV